jgi:aspartate/methionine/tyrosine aminotransferase
MGFSIIIYIMELDIYPTQLLILRSSLPAGSNLGTILNFYSCILLDLHSIIWFYLFFFCGYMVSKHFIRPIQKLQQNFFILANAMVQIAGIAAIKQAGEEILRMKRIYNERRQYMIRRLKDMGLGITVEPTGAFYIFANAKHISQDSYNLAFDILEKAHVGVAPGIDFGKNGEGYLRFSYATSMENIAQGMDRVENYFKKTIS